jgi:type I restriction enzyme M protein
MDSLRALTYDNFPFAEILIPDHIGADAALPAVVGLVSQPDKAHVPSVADAILEQAAKALGKRGGEYLTPPSVRRLVTAVAQPSGTVYNPATGIGQLMIAAAEHSDPGVKLVGQEINQRVWAMAGLNLAIHNVEADVALGDVFTSDRFPQLRADRVIAVPPWNMRFTQAGRLAADPRWIWGVPGPNDGNMAWIEHCLYHLGETGRAVIVMANGVLSEGGRAGGIRQGIIKAGLLDTVIALPGGLFHSTLIPCAVLVFTKGRQNLRGKPAPTLMVDIRGVRLDGERATRSLPEDLIGQVSRLYLDWAAGKAPAPASGLCSVASFDDLAANDFVITPGRYVGVSDLGPDITDAVAERTALLSQLESLSIASHATDEQLHAILQGTQ